MSKYIMYNRMNDKEYIKHLEESVEALEDQVFLLKKEIAQKLGDATKFTQNLFGNALKIALEMSEDQEEEEDVTKEFIRGIPKREEII